MYIVNIDQRTFDAGNKHKEAIYFVCISDISIDIIMRKMLCILYVELKKFRLICFETYLLQSEVHRIFEIYQTIAVAVNIAAAFQSSYR